MTWLWWVGAALVLGVVETLTVDLTFLMFAGGALGGGVVAVLHGPFWLQVLVFALVSTLLLGAVRPWAKRHLAATTPEMRTNAEALVGREAVALTAVDERGGRIRLGGEEWSARLGAVPTPGYGYARSRVEPGAAVQVTAIDGAIAVVSAL